ncbi:seminal fluid protein HACP007 [Danaus plexippus plexippus]|uniref:Seminal fluid protein HACP007 n=1 Tax=Danaus plexippus plexippus TaxID=278856 RepID=A0A212FKN2_DANPL|nr:seminal fluid protein HACP007 [Danaus plexippus plexippus]
MLHCFAISNLTAPERRIVEGYKVGIHLYPHSVFLHFQKDIPTACGATLITDQSIITSANCLYEVNIRNGKITAYFGASVPINANVKRQVELFSIHRRFNAETGKFNLGIAYLNKAVPLKNEIQKIPISVKLPKTNEALHTTGWGKDVPGKLPDYSDLRHLKATKQRTISPRQCQNITKSRMTPAFWCTISINGHHYHGDDGNGLVNSENQLIGVVSFMVNDITVYSDVMREQLWIYTTVMDLFKKMCTKRKMLY